MKNVRLMHHSAMRRIKRRKARQHTLNIIRGFKRSTNVKRERLRKDTWFRQKNVVIISNFALLKNTEAVIQQVQEIITIKRDRNFTGVLLIRMDSIKNLDIGAIGLLLSAFHALQDTNIRIGGTLPQDEYCRTLLFDSGFFDYAKLVQGIKPKKKNENNLFLEWGFDKTENEKVRCCIRNAVCYLTGTQNKYRPVFSILQEMCANSVEHANKRKERKNWLVAVYHENNKVIFNMIDIGAGILGTLKKKKSQVIRDFIQLNNDIDVLKGVFRRKYQSSTLDENRNNGLPRIEEMFINGYIEKLKVISNNVFIDFESPNISRELATNFKGTYYYFELTKNAIEKWQNRILLKQ